MADKVVSYNHMLWRITDSNPDWIESYDSVAKKWVNTDSLATISKKQHIDLKYDTQLHVLCDDNVWYHKNLSGIFVPEGKVATGGNKKVIYQHETIIDRSKDREEAHTSKGFSFVLKSVFRLLWWIIKMIGKILWLPIRFALALVNA